MASVEDRRRITIRLTILQYLITVVFSVLAVSFWVLQVVQHAKFEEMAENNHQRTLALRAPRGLVLDRDGKVLVENRQSYSISIVREHTKDLNRTIRLLAAVLGIDEAGVRTIVDRHRREPSYRPITIVQDATLAQVSAVRARRLDFELPDVVVEQVPTRRYPETIGAHLFGYVGEVNDAQVAGGEGGLKSGDIVGQSGIEKVYNAMLMGQDGAKRVVVNSVGREIRTLEEEQPTEGKRLQLTVDIDVQKAIEDGFDSLGFNGAAVVLDPNNGDVLGFTSRPAYDPNAFAAGIDRVTWASLTSDEDRPLNDRAIQGRYSPGSTFKMAVATAALQEGVITPDFKVHCVGSATFYGRPFKCWKKGGHGTMDLRHAIEQSCNVYFYTIGNMTGIDKIHKWATLLGLGEKSGIDLPNEVQGLVPSPEWKQQYRKEKWYAGETVSVSIGQGSVSVTPVSMAVYAATLANGGTRVTPHLLKAVDDGSGWKPVPPPAPRSREPIDPVKLQAIRDGLWMVVNQAGTGHNALIKGPDGKPIHDVSGKTGTAQVISNQGKERAGKTDKDLRDNGWFVFFAPRDNPQIAGVVFLEHGVHGSNAALVAHHVLDTFFAKKDGRPLPPRPELKANLVP
ncbi:MAG: penicillin-binding protein 2 [Acidobacteria bacterium 13_1_40CM_65_14]|nr:MAG: penicillin-binding protein 2 [Acidobacteria bacterium 13_1_40CM_65_14]